MLLWKRLERVQMCNIANMAYGNAYKIKGFFEDCSETCHLWPMRIRWLGAHLIDVQQKFYSAHGDNVTSVAHSLCFYAKMITRHWRIFFSYKCRWQGDVTQWQSCRDTIEKLRSRTMKFYWICMRGSCIIYHVSGVCSYKNYIRNTLNLILVSILVLSNSIALYVLYLLLAKWHSSVSHE